MIMQVLPTMMAAGCLDHLFYVFLLLPTRRWNQPSSPHLGAAGRLGEVSHRGAGCRGRVVEGLW